ncbi:MAG: hypothetical protein AAF467_12655 [Actinomycetota bacterium]
MGLITGSARNLGLAALLLFTAVRRRPEELWLALGLRAFVDLCDMVLSFGAPALNPISIIVAGLFAAVAGFAVWSAHRMTDERRRPDRSSNPPRSASSHGAL